MLDLCSCRQLPTPGHTDHDSHIENSGDYFCRHVRLLLLGTRTIDFGFGCHCIVILCCIAAKVGFDEEARSTRSSAVAFAWESSSHGRIQGKNRKVFD